MDGLFALNKYAFAAIPQYHTLPNLSIAQQTTEDKLPLDRTREIGVESVALYQEYHGILHPLREALRNTKVRGKNTDLLEAAADVCLSLQGSRITFCKSGKDRTGMSVTLFQARKLSDFGCGSTEEQIIERASCMRIHGTRLKVAEKNIGRPVFSINLLQAQFLPLMYRPPPEVCESMLKKDSS
jgi:hypothetical protein